jgi:hypothetical protein
MAPSPSHKSLDEVGLYEHGQDSAVDLQDVAESSQAQAQLPPSSQVHQLPEDNTAEEDDNDDTDFESDSAFDSGSLLGKEILDFAHHMYLLTLDQKLYLAPIQSPQTILDAGTGTGIWAIV